MQSLTSWFPGREGDCYPPAELKRTEYLVQRNMRVVQRTCGRARRKQLPRASSEIRIRLSQGNPDGGSRRPAR